MPTLDSENFFTPAMDIALRCLNHELGLVGRDNEKIKISYLNIYFGTDDLRMDIDSPWHICLPREYGFVVVVFHFIRHGSILKTNNPHLANCRGLCITPLWTTEGNLQAEFFDALATADKIVAKAELCLGRPIPLPLTRLQIPTNFAVKTMDLTSSSGKKNVNVKLTPIVEDNLLHKFDVISIGALMMDDAENSSYFNTPAKSAMAASANWQRLAIRAGGTECWAEMVVASNIWIETFLVQFTKFLIDATRRSTVGKTDNSKKGNFIGYVTKHLGCEVLGDKWDRRDRKTKFGRW